MPLTTQSDFETYIKSAPPSLGLDTTLSYALQELSGGTANFVYRLTPPSGEPSILKHAEPFVRNSPSIAFPQTRMNFEAQVLQVVAKVLPADDVVHPVAVRGYDADAHVLHLEDGGSKTLKDAYEGLSKEIVEEVGNRLGVWLARFHAAGNSLDVGENGVARTIYRHSYNNVSRTLAQFGHDKELGDYINSTYGSLLQTDHQTQAHGDFWPGNVLVSSLSPLKLTIVDWEMSRRGVGATDVGQFAAEAWLLDRFRGGKGLLPAFLRAYAAERRENLKPEDEERVAVQFGTHLAYWAAVVDWGDQSETAECVALGAEFLKRVRNGDDLWLSKSVLKGLFAQK
jgi:Ser/Thr protein kinase RdoA (MazF antagonist)